VDIVASVSTFVSPFLFPTPRWLDPSDFTRLKYWLLAVLQGRKSPVEDDPIPRVLDANCLGEEDENSDEIAVPDRRRLLFHRVSLSRDSEAGG
jgi:hypothetical protein